MIIEKQTDIEILTDGEETQSSTAMSLDLDSAQMLMQMLSKNLYSDGIGSTIRETASNALDSHRRAGIKEPIIVSLERNKEDNIEFSVEDFGSGLDDNDITNIISKYGKSTKRMEANALGMFGLGFKSPLAYTSSFYFICRKNGIERKYMMYEGEDINTIDLLYETTTTERNGVKVIVPVKSSDRYQFFTKIKEQLSYFEDVYFNINTDYYKIDNNFIIFRGTSFQFSELNSDQKMHICLDNVYYPLEFSKIGITPILIPIALRFNLTDGIYPTPNRESIRYTPEAITVIKSKLEEVANYYMEKFNESISDSMDIRSILSFYTGRGYSYKPSFTKTDFLLNDLLKFSTIKMKTPSVTNVKHLNLQKLAGQQSVLLQEYSKKYSLNNGRLSELKNWQSTVTINNLDDNCHLFSETFTSSKKAFIKDLYKNKSTQYFIKKVGTITLFSKSKTTVNGRSVLDNYYTILGLHNVKKCYWREIIKEFQYIRDLFINELNNIDNIKISEAWLAQIKSKGKAVTGKGAIRRTKLEGEVIGRIGVPLQRYVSGKASKLETITLKLSEIEKHKCLYVYGGVNDISLLDNLFDIVGTKQKVKTLVFSDRELRVLEKVKIHNLMHIKNFMEGKNKVFKRLITAYAISKLIDEHQNTFRNSCLLKNISTSLFNDLEQLEQYKNKNFVFANTTIYDAMLNVALEQNLFDGEIYPLFLRIHNLLNKLQFLEPIMRRMAQHARVNPSDETDMHLVLCDLFKYYRIKLNYENYNLVLNENTTVLQEEVIEQLID